MVLFFFFMRSPHPYFGDTLCHSCSVTLTSFTIQFTNSFQAFALLPNATSTSLDVGWSLWPINAFLNSILSSLSEPQPEVPKQPPAVPNPSFSDGTELYCAFRLRRSDR